MLGYWCVGVIRMGFSKDVVTESKYFSLVKDGGFLVIIERSWRVVTKLLLGSLTV